MPRLSNKEIVTQLKEVLAAMEINNENRFAIRAYQNAIAAIDNLTISVYDLWENDRLSEISGVGSSLSQHITELLEKGKVKEWEIKKKDLPEGMFPLLVLRGVGAKTAFKLAEHFNIDDRSKALETIKKAAKNHEIQELSGFGEKSEKDILDSIEDEKNSKQEKPRMLLVHAEEIAERVVAYLKELPEVEDAVPLGSLRRRSSTVGDLDIAVSSEEPEKVIDHFVKFPEIKDIESQGDRMSTVILGTGAQVDVLVSDPDAFGSMLQHFTGSKQHNIKLRQFALDQKKSLSQYGIKDKADKDKLHKFSSEERFYGYLGLKWIPPELREGKEEIELAARDKLPDLIELKDIKGDLHTHTVASDGEDSLEAMVNAAIEKGYSYMGITDHAPSVTNRGKYEVLGIMEKTRYAIDQLNEKLASEDINFKVLYGYEVNILKDKTLGMPDELLEKLDYAIGAIHTSFDLSREENTERVISAMENPYIKILAHPTGRQINQRDPMDIDWTNVFEVIKKNNKILEIDAQPLRLDLPDHLVEEAIKMGINVSIDTDAHAIDQLDFMKYGIDVARKGWCTKDNVINTLPLEKLYNLISK